ncbi:MAG: LysR family transcriptional regulator, partial [Candidatus Eisenbacteria bacterium]
MTLPTLDQLRAFDAVARNGGLTAAAREMGRTTPAVSYAVGQVEQLSGIKLFDRERRRLAITAEGRLLLAEARKVLRAADRFGSVGSRVAEGWEAELRVVLDGIVPQGPILNALHRFGLLGAPTRVQILVGFLGDVQARFEREHCDLMLALDLENDGSLRVADLPPIEMVLLAHRKHPLHARPQPLSRADLREFVELVVVQPEQLARRPSDPLFHGSDQVFQLPDFIAKREALLRGIGYGWLPRHLAEGEMARRRLVP